MRPSFSSAAGWSSTCLRSRSTFWAASGSCQKLCCEDFCSNAERRLRFSEAVKIAPHKLDAFLQFVVSMFQSFENHSLSLLLPALSARKQKNCGSHYAEPRHPVAPAGVQRAVGAKVVRGIERATDVRGKARDNPPVRVHRNRESVIRRAQQPPAVLHGAYARPPPGRGGRCPPAQTPVVREVC